MLGGSGIPGHLCTASGAVFGDCPQLLSSGARKLTLSLELGVLMLARPSRTLSRNDLTRVRGYGGLYLAQWALLQERAGDVATASGLTLHERYVLGRRLAGLAPVDIARECGLSVQTVSASLDAGVALLGGTEREAIALAARRGWLLENLCNPLFSQSKRSL